MERDRERRGGTGMGGEEKSRPQSFLKVGAYDCNNQMNTRCSIQQVLYSRRSLTGGVVTLEGMGGPPIMFIGLVL